ncbi:helix-turn-helix transcriptional regulator [Bacillus mobilis]|uniref:helix-turn-helix transcriptional regulator n=1 Tax=Bacillus mobilis TaxID=2026190 RepID=UPI003CF755A4
MLKGVLQIISYGVTYGYEITQQLRALDCNDIVEGTVYIITMWLEKINSCIWRKTFMIGPPHKFYRLNEVGQ